MQEVPAQKRGHCHQSRIATARVEIGDGPMQFGVKGVHRAQPELHTNPEVTAETRENNQAYPLALVKGRKALLDVALPNQPQVSGQRACQRRRQRNR